MRLASMISRVFRYGEQAAVFIVCAESGDRVFGAARVRGNVHQLSHGLHLVLSFYFFLKGAAAITSITIKYRPYRM